MLEHDFQHQVTPLERKLGRAERIVSRRPLDHTDQQRQLLGFEVLDATAKQHAAGTGETMNGNPVLLQQKNFVDVSRNNCPFIEAQLHDQRHERLVELA